MRTGAILSLAALLLPATTYAGGRDHTTGRAAKPHWQVLLTSPAVTAPAGITVDLRGNPKVSKWAYVADAATQRIVKFGTGGKVLGSWQYGDPMNEGTPAAVAVGGTGNVFVAHPLTGTVTKYSPSGKLLARWSGFQEPRGVAVDRSGNIFVADYNARTVTKLSPGGSILRQFPPDKLYPPGGPGSPIGVAIEPPDSLYISTTCVIGTTCGVGSDVAPHGDLLDGLYEILSQGPRQGYLKEIWFGLGYLSNGSPQQPPYKEAEPFAAIDAITGDRKGNLYVAGLLWPLGGKPKRGVLAYTPGYPPGRRQLMSVARRPAPRTPHPA